MASSYYIRKEKGLCTKCGQAPPADGLLSCRTCREILSKRDQKRRATAIGLGRCSYCLKDPPVLGRKRCLSCLLRDKLYHKQLKDRVFSYYGGYVCVCCGENHKEFLQLDHIAGGGREHRETIGVGTKFWLWLINNDFPDGFRVLCANCNWGRRNGGICPHERERGKILGPTLWEKAYPGGREEEE